jgi:hypothetical protein
MKEKWQITENFLKSVISIANYNRIKFSRVFIFLPDKKFSKDDKKGGDKNE